MKILFLSCWYPTEKNPNFGIFVKEHAHAIHLTDNEIVVLSIVIHRDKKIFDTTISDFLDEKGMRTVLIEINTRFRDLLYHLIPLQYLIVKSIFKKRIRKYFEPDIIHSNVIFPAGIIGHWLSMFLKKPHVITEHWTRVRNFKKMPILSYWGKESYNKCSKILPVSIFLKNEIIESFSVDENKFKVIGNVIDAELFKFQEKTKTDNELRLCSIATWSYLKHPAKQPELVINAVHELQKSGSQSISLIMIGGGNKVNELIKLCKEKEVNATFTGYLNKQEIVKKLHESDFFVHPTNIETFGVVVAESLLTGTPVICSNVPALRELINNENGVLVENTIEDWIEAINLAQRKNFETEKNSNLVRNEFSSKQIGKNIASVYFEINHPA